MRGRLIALFAVAAIGAAAIVGSTSSAERVAAQVPELRGQTLGLLAALKHDNTASYGSSWVTTLQANQETAQGNATTPKPKPATTIPVPGKSAPTRANSTKSKRGSTAKAQQAQNGTLQRSPEVDQERTDVERRPKEWRLQRARP